MVLRAIKRRLLSAKMAEQESSALRALKGEPHRLIASVVSPSRLVKRREPIPSPSRFPPRFMLEGRLTIGSHYDLGNARAGLCSRLHRLLVLCQLGRAASSSQA